MKKSILALAMLAWSLHALCQGVLTDFDTSDFPAVSFSLHTLNPDTSALAHMRVVEDGKQVPVTAAQIIAGQSPASKSNVLLLWDNGRTGQFTAEMLYDLLSGMIASSQMSDSLKVNIAVFRRDDKGQKVFAPLSPQFVSALDDMRQKVTAEAERELASTADVSDLGWALEQAVKQLSRQPADEARAIILFTAGRADINSGPETSAVIQAATQNRVLIYVVNIDGDQAGKSLCERIAQGTHGQWLACQGSFAASDSRKAQRASGARQYTFVMAENETVGQWIAQLPQRWSGTTCRVTFTSHLDRVGQPRPLTVQLGDDTLQSTYNVPGFSLWAWAKAHLIMSVIALVLLLTALAAGGYWWWRRRRVKLADRRDREEALEAERQQLKSEQQQLRRRVEIAEDTRQRREQQERAQQRTDREQQQRDKLDTLMRQRGVRARLLVFAMTGSTEHLVASSEVTIGQATDNDIVIADPTVSRHHARLYYDGTGFRIADLQSTNGIVMNNIKVDDLALRDGDTFRLGNTTIKIYL